MVGPATLDTLAMLEREMAQAGRTAEREALHEVLTAVARPGNGLLSTGDAAARLGVSLPTVKRWVRRGVLAGGQWGTRWLVAAESVERALRLRVSLALLDQEGNPTEEEIQDLYHSRRRRDTGSPAACA